MVQKEVDYCKLRKIMVLPGTIRIVVAAPGRPIGGSSFGFDNDSGYTELQIGANLKKCQQTIKSFKNFVEFANTNLS